MSAFEFLFSFYGLLLGLALTEVIAGFSRALNERGRRPIGWLTPLLAVVLTLDLMTFWASAWTDLRDVQFTARLLLFAGAAPMIYFFAAKQVFPDAGSDAPSLDDHFFAHRRWVIGGVVASNIISYLPVLTEPGMVARLLGNFIYMAPLALAAVTRRRWLIGLILATETAWLLWLLLARL
jgi:hypothetical protein